MRKAAIISLACFFCTLALYAQEISGTILDSNTGQPVDFAAVYINGTTYGTISDSAGRFLLEYSNLPDNILVSHINYTTTLVEINETRMSGMLIQLERRIFSLIYADILAESKREENLERFKKAFLGEDSWGKKAIIENDSVLRFKVEYYDDSSMNAFLFSGIKSFEVEALEPLIITLPKLGYVLHYDLVNFNESYDSTLRSLVMHTLGYSYFQPITDVSTLKRNMFLRNRKEAYYFSSMHFTRSLYEKKLSENGYQLLELLDPLGLLIDNRNLDLNSCVSLVHGTNEASLIGLNNRYFHLRFYGTKYTPIDLSSPQILLSLDVLPAAKRSRVYFLKEKCIIRKDGTRPGGSIVFSGDIGNKRIGASLPYNYDPNSKVKPVKKSNPKKLHQEMLKKGRI